MPQQHNSLRHHRPGRNRRTHIAGLNVLDSDGDRQDTEHSSPDRLGMPAHLPRSAGRELGLAEYAAQRAVPVSAPGIPACESTPWKVAQKKIERSEGRARGGLSEYENAAVRGTHDRCGCVLQSLHCVLPHLRLREARSRRAVNVGRGKALRLPCSP